MIGACTGADQRVDLTTLPPPSSAVIDVTDPQVDETIAEVDSAPPVSPECAIGYEGYLTVAGSLNAEDPAILRGLRSDVARARAALPDSVIDDFDIVTEAMLAYVDTVLASDDPATDPAVVEALEALSARRVSAASEALNTYFGEECVSR